MLDFFTIFSKGGIVLWCFQSTGQAFTPSVNALIKSVILQERSGIEFTHEALKLKYKLDNEFELVFVVAYQKILQLSYVDKLISDVAMEFRNKYKDDLQDGNVSRNFDFADDFKILLKNAENASILEAKAPKQMKTFKESQKSQKTVSSMIENKNKKEEPVKKGKKNKPDGKQEVASNNKSNVTMASGPQTISTNGELDQETILRNREKLFNRGKKKQEKASSPKAGENEQPTKKGKAARVWDLGGSNNSKALDYGNKAGSGDTPEEQRSFVTDEEYQLVGQLKGNLQDLQPESSDDEEEEDEDEVEEIVPQATTKSAPRKGFGGFGFLSGLKNLVGSKTLTRQDIEPALSKMKDHLISKNVAADVSAKLCDSVATKLEGKVMGTFSSVASTVKQSLEDSCVQILSPKRRVDILRDAIDAKAHSRPYVITFCGVNGVGKSTNLAKICFWLIENGFRVLIAACDTFRAGAVEQLKTHMRKLNMLHPAEKHGGQERVSVYEKGYGKDPAGIAMEAINFARDRKVDIVLIDTAGRMQDNEPLMRALAKLIKVNQPDLVLFVGEALVGNDAIDQLTKFNQSLADHSQSEKPQLIDGIVLTKFDTIDDKVGAAISMTYTTGQPIVFVGTGQTYTDLRNLNAKAVVHALLKN